jgi:hypothetical protein
MESSVYVPVCATTGLSVVDGGVVRGGREVCGPGGGSEIDWP